MTDSNAALIIPFPIHAVTRSHASQAAPARTTPDQTATLDRTATAANGTQASPEARLARALTTLNDAMIAQRAAMTAWSAALGDLRGATKRLGSSLVTYQDRLGRLDERAAGLRAEAKKLEKWADGVLARDD
jgi:hypothetical protein